MPIAYFSEFKRLRRGNNIDDSLPEENSANDSAKTIEEDLYDETTVEREDIYEDTVIVEEETYDDVETKKGITVFSSVLGLTT